MSLSKVSFYFGSESLKIEAAEKLLTEFFYISINKKFFFVKKVPKKDFLCENTQLKSF